LTELIITEPLPAYFFHLSFLSVFFLQGRAIVVRPPGQTINNGVNETEASHPDNVI